MAGTQFTPTKRQAQTATSSGLPRWPGEKRGGGEENEQETRKAGTANRRCREDGRDVARRTGREKTQKLG